MRGLQPLCSIQHLKVIDAFSDIINYLLLELIFPYVGSEPPEFSLCYHRVEFAADAVICLT